MKACENPREFAPQSHAPLVTAALADGLNVVFAAFHDTTDDSAVNYDRVRVELAQRYDELRESASAEYLDKMLQGLVNWVEAADNGYLAWGIQRFRKPAD